MSNVSTDAAIIHGMVAIKALGVLASGHDRRRRQYETRERAGLQGSQVPVIRGLLAKALASTGTHRSQILWTFIEHSRISYTSS